MVNPTGYTNFVDSNIWLMWVCIIVMIASECALFCNRSLARSVPSNFVILGIFTISMSYLVSYICIQYTTESVLIAMAITSAMTVGLSVYAIRTKTDFTVMGAFLFGL